MMLQLLNVKLKSGDFHLILIYIRPLVGNLWSFLSFMAVRSALRYKISVNSRFVLSPITCIFHWNSYTWNILTDWIWDRVPCSETDRLYIVTKFGIYRFQFRHQRKFKKDIVLNKPSLIENSYPWGTGN